MSFKRYFFVFLVFLLSSGCSLANTPNRNTLPPVTLEFRYRIPGAGEVVFVWGINGWVPLGEDQRPPGTRIIDNLMNTPMVQEGDEFIVSVTVPAWSAIDYGFQVTRLADGTRIEPLWDGGDGYRKQVLERGETLEIDSSLDLNEAQPFVEPAQATSVASAPAEQVFVTREVRFILEVAGEVQLVWGINDWMPVPEEIRPPETTLNDNVMNTMMTNTGEAFVVEVRIPTGSTLDYGFLVTRTREGNAIQVWLGGEGDGYHEIVTEPGISEVISDVKLENEDSIPSVLIVGLYLLAGIALILIVGLLFRRR